jgi:hypothetical protein
MGIRKRDDSSRIPASPGLKRYSAFTDRESARRINMSSIVKPNISFAAANRHTKLPVRKIGEQNGHVGTRQRV